MFVCANLQDESPEESLEHYGSQVMAAASQLSDVYLESKYLLCMTIHTIYMSRFCDAAEFCLRMRQLGERASDPRTIAMSQWGLGFVNIFEEQYEEALENAEASLKNSPDPLDKLMARTVIGAAQALKGDPVKGLSVLKDVRSEMFDAGYIAPLLGVDIPYGAAIALAGKMRAGVRWIKDSIERSAELGNKTQSALGRLVLGEIYLQMALGENKPPLSIVIRNLGFILTSMPFAARSSRQYLEQATREFRQSDAPANLARALMDLALLNQMQKRTDEAEACLIEASSISESQAHALHAKITQMLRQFDLKQNCTL
jgi:tetratricopeptide (TPR) repeat protein